MSSQTTTPKLDQEQSKILDDLWFEEKHSAKGRRYYEKKLDDNTDNVKDIFHNLGSESVVNYAGIWRYTLGSDRIFKNAVRSGGSGGSGSGSIGSRTTTKSDYNEGAKKGHEENVQMHKEFMQKMDEVISALKAVEDALRAKANTD